MDSKATKKAADPSHEHEGGPNGVDESFDGVQERKGLDGVQEREGPSTIARQHQCYEVHRGQGVEQLEQGLHQGHLWPMSCLRQKNGPPTPTYDVCKNNFASADSLSLPIFTPKHSKMKFRYKFFKNGPKIIKLGVF